MHKEFIVALVLIKKAAAVANGKAGNIPSSIARAIARACDQILDSDLDGEISLPSFQGGAGTIWKDPQPT